MKKLILITILAFVLGLSMAKDKIIELSVEKIASYVMGTRLEIRFMKVGLFRPVIIVKGMTLYNPPGYPEKVMAEIPEFYIKYSSGKLSKGQMYFTEMRLYLKQFTVIKTEDGRVNAAAIKPVRDKEPGQEIQEKDKGTIPDIRIEKLYLKADRIFYKDYSKGGNASVREFNVNIDETYENIDDPYTLVRIIIARITKNTPLSQMISIPVAGIKGIYTATGAVVGNAVKTVGAATGVVLDEARVIGKIFKAPAEKNRS
ncbi:MAG: hypothetical protein ABH883_02085 [Candidatus Omnitrophota bacterium]